MPTIALAALFVAFAQLASPSAARAEAALDGPRTSTEGFYPIWENTGFIEKHREAYIGTNGAHYGIGDIAQVGVQPVNFIYRSPNVYAKIRLLEQEDRHVALQAGTYYLMSEASRAFFSPTYSSRLDNPDFGLLLLPVSLTATSQFSDWLDLHQTLTALPIYSPSGDLSNSLYFGYSAVAELKARARHSVLLHAGEVGFWNHDFSTLGISYRYHNSWMEFRVGYFYRLRSQGMQSAPLIGFGFVI